MKVIHLSDIHLGKRVNGFSMIEDQKYILTKILNILDSEKADAVLIAGDVYDKSVPSTEAVQLFDDFLRRLANRRIPTFIISGNHDSAERLSFGSSLIDLSGIHISPVFNGEIKPYILEDAYGKVNVYLLPFIKPVHVRALFEDAEISDYTDAMKFVIDKIGLNTNERNIILSHQFITGADRCDSEEISVGGTDNADVSVFDGFDYVALGHIHGPQKISRDTVRYCGTPLKYSFSECSHKKSVTVVELKEKGNVTVSTVPLEPIHDMREIKGNFEDITKKENYENTNTDDYVRIILTDENDIPDVMNKIRCIYPNVMEVKYDNTRTRASVNLIELENIESKSNMDLFADFFEMQNGQPMTEEQQKIIEELFERGKENE